MVSIFEDMNSEHVRTEFDEAARNPLSPCPICGAPAQWSIYQEQESWEIPQLYWIAEITVEHRIDDCAGDHIAEMAMQLWEGPDAYINVARFWNRRPETIDQELKEREEDGRQGTQDGGDSEVHDGGTP